MTCRVLQVRVLSDGSSETGADPAGADASSVDFTIYASVAQVRGRVQPHPFPDHRAERVVGYLDTT
jgi:hypothetical protein